MPGETGTPLKAETKNEWQKFLALISPFSKEFDWDHWLDWIDGWGFSRALFLSILYVGLLSVLSLQIPPIVLFAFGWIIGTSPIWLPIAMIIGYYHIWVWYARSLYIFNTETVLLEMKIPREISKSPRAMETAIGQLWSFVGTTTFVQRIWLGQVQPWYSFELVSIGGEVHFYIWLWKMHQQNVEAAFYAQYPEIELHEVEDYSKKFVYDPATQTCHAMLWRLEPHNPKERYVDAYPIKTYIDLELDKDPKEEFKVDPLANVVEFMSNIKPTQQIWMQIILTGATQIGVLVRRDHDWKRKVEEEVQKVRRLAAIFPTTSSTQLTEDEKRFVRPRPTWTQEHQLETMQRNLGKWPFEVSMRGILISNHADTGRVYWNLRWIWRAYANPQYMTQLRPRGWHTIMTDYPWQDYADIRWEIITYRFIDAYRRRSAFYSPWQAPTNVMTSEVLASIFHPPSSGAKAPGVRRIPATKAAPPADLPK